MHGARVSTESCARGCHWFPRLFAASEQVFDPMACLSGVPSLTGVAKHHVQTLKDRAVHGSAGEPNHCYQPSRYVTSVYIYSLELGFERIFQLLHAIGFHDSAGG